MNNKNKKSDFKNRLSQLKSFNSCDTMTLCDTDSTDLQMADEGTIRDSSSRRHDTGLIISGAKFTRRNIVLFALLREKYTITH
jgi:hypothetical protein